ncbi:hypothetical protein ACQCN2_09470 [Brevibacillus ginsengisoli]|uniref:hypothetical protein n=1 Tax=Brevibacillus ginsengisoli TaxID=363854 RepID=UPI003CFAC77D
MIGKIKEYGITFRKVIQTMGIDEFPQSSFFENFPRGCCGDTSDLFAKFLSSHGISTYYVWGLKSEQSHAWLEYEDIIIDLTADQFDEIQDEVIVTTERSWHNQFVVQNKRLCDFDEYNNYNANRLRTIYNNILNRIE